MYYFLQRIVSKWEIITIVILYVKILAVVPLTNRKIPLIHFTQAGWDEYDKK